MTTTSRRQATEPAVAAAIETGCRTLRLPTIRDRFAEIAAAAEREQLTNLGFLAELVMAECDDRTHRRAERRIRAAGFPRPNGWRSSTSPRTPRSTRPRSVSSPPATGSVTVNRCV